MLPLDPLASSSTIARLLKGAPAAEVRAELSRLSEESGADGADGAESPGSAGGPGSADGSPGSPQRASLLYARGAFALREGELDAAHADLSAAADAFEALGEAQAARLSRCEAILAAVRRGPRDVFARSIDALAALEKEAGDDARLRAVALHYMGAATRASGDAIGTQRLLLSALAASDRALDERAKILNSLGTLYVVLGAFGAAKELLEHAAELHHQNGDAVGEAIAYGQLGAAALGLGDLEGARRSLQKQEWLAARVGDVFGRARALTFLADVALELGRPDDAVLFATMARDLAKSATPPLRMWIAYSTRAIGRAKAELGDADALPELRAASDLFAAIGNPLGSSLTEWDLAAHDPASVEEGGAASGVVTSVASVASVASVVTPGGASAPAGAPATGKKGSWFSAAWGLASLGLASRVAQLLRDQRSRAAEAGEKAPRASELAIAAVAQAAPHIAVAQEVGLVHDDPEELSAIAGRRTAAQRNLARLAALTLAGPGILIAVVASPRSQPGRALPPERSAAALAYELPGVAVWVWAASASPADVSRDLGALRGALGSDARAALTSAKGARVISPPFAGEVCADIEGIDLYEDIVSTRGQKAGTLLVSASVKWSDEADSIAARAGYSVTKRA